MAYDVEKPLRNAKIENQRIESATGEVGQLQAPLRLVVQSELVAELRIEDPESR